MIRQHPLTPQRNQRVRKKNKKKHVTEWKEHYAWKFEDNRYLHRTTGKNILRVQTQ